MQHLVGATKKRFFGILKNAFHQWENRTADNQVDVAFLFVQVPITLHVAEYRRIHPLELLELVDDKSEGMRFGIHKQISE